MVKTIRPDWDDFCKSTIGAYIYCSCGVILNTMERVREHWQAGHFDCTYYEQRSEYLGVLICEALGVPADRVSDITIFIPPSGQGPVQVTLDAFCIDDEFETIDWKELLRGAEVTVTVERIDTHSECEEAATNEDSGFNDSA